MILKPISSANSFIYLNQRENVVWGFSNILLPPLFYTFDLYMSASQVIFRSWRAVKKVRPCETRRSFQPRKLFGQEWHICSHNGKWPKYGSILVGLARLSQNDYFQRSFVSECISRINYWQGMESLRGEKRAIIYREICVFCQASIRWHQLLIENNHLGSN